MRLTRKKIEELLVLLVGEEFLPLFGSLHNKEKVSEFDIAEELKVDIKLVRKQLYVLYNHNFVSYDRKKDKMKGWYIYYWTLIPENIRFAYVREKKRMHKKLTERLEREENELYYVCPNRCVRLPFDKALEYDYHCPECAEMFVQDDPEKQKESIKRLLADLDEELDKIKEFELARKAAARKMAVIAKKREEKEKAVKKKATKKKTTKTVTKKKVTKKKVVKKKIVKKKAAAKERKTAVKKKAAKKRKAVTKKKVTKKKTVKKKATKKKKK